jgi:hypothetical protein
LPAGRGYGRLRPWALSLFRIAIAMIGAMRSGSAASCVRWWFHQGILRFEFFDASPDPCHARPGDGVTPSTPNASTYRGRAHLRLRIPIINTPPHLALAVAVEVSQRSLDVSNFAQPSPWNGRIRYKLGHGSVNSTVTVKVRLQRRGSGRPYAPSPVRSARRSSPAGESRPRRSVMATKSRPSFDPKSFLAVVGEGRGIGEYRKDQIVFRAAS